MTQEASTRAQEPLPTAPPVGEVGWPQARTRLNARSWLLVVASSVGYIGWGTVLLLAFLAGVYSLLTMPRREDPRITIRVGLVVAYFPGATSEQVEAQVTQKLEEYLFRFSEVRKEKTYSPPATGR